MSIIDQAFSLFKGAPDHVKAYIKGLGRVGEKADLRQEGTLDYMVGEGYSFMGYEYSGASVPPKQMVEYALYTLERDGYQLPEQIAYKFAELISHMALRYLDSWDPRFPLYYTELSDTSDWRNFTYTITNADQYYFSEGEVPLMIGKDQVEMLDTFAVIPGRDESVFNEFYREDHARYTMFEVQDEIVTDYFREFCNSADLEMIMEDFEESELDIFHQFFWDENNKRKLYYNANGQTEHRHFYTLGSRKEEVDLIEHVTEVLACGALIWFCSPMARVYRVDNHELFWLADQYDEFIIYDRILFSPDCYQKTELPPTCCNTCGVDAYCVEILHGIGGQSLQMCNGCVSKGGPTLPQATCGTKFCKHIECIHNKYNGMGEKGRYAMDANNPYSYLSYKRSAKKPMPFEQKQIALPEEDPFLALLGG